MAAHSVRLHPLVVDTIKRLKVELAEQEGHNASQEEIVAALVHGATVPQLAGMLIAFNRYAAQSTETDPHTPT